MCFINEKTLDAFPKMTSLYTRKSKVTGLKGEARCIFMMSIFQTTW